MTTLQLLLAKILGVVALGIGLFVWGHHVGAEGVQAAWTAANAKQAMADITRVKASDVVTQQVITQYVDRVQLVLTQGATITRTITHVITPEVDRKYLVPIGLVRVLDASASGQALDANATGRADDAATPVAMSQLAGVISDNYGACRANAVQLEQLQAWIRQQQAITNKAP